jgi:hypothetical protein
MPTLFISATGARVAITTDDHCPTHVHALHRGEGWLVRAEFSYVSNDGGILAIEPSERAVRQRQLNLLLDEILDHLAACRRVWWEIRGTTCLPNRWVMVQANRMTVLEEWRPDARQVKAAVYDSSSGTTRIVFWLGNDIAIANDSGELV